MCQVVSNVKELVLPYTGNYLKRYLWRRSTRSDLPSASGQPPPLRQVHCTVTLQITACCHAGCARIYIKLLFFLALYQSVQKIMKNFINVQNEKQFV